MRENTSDVIWNVLHFCQAIMSCNFQDTWRKVFKISEYVYLVLIRSNPGLSLISLFCDYPKSSDQPILTGSGQPVGAWGGGQFCCNGEYRNITSVIARHRIGCYGQLRTQFHGKKSILCDGMKRINPYHKIRLVD